MGPMKGNDSNHHDVDWDREDSYGTGSFQKMRKWNKSLVVKAYREFKEGSGSHMKTVGPINDELLLPYSSRGGYGCGSSPGSPKGKRKSTGNFKPLVETEGGDGNGNGNDNDNDNNGNGNNGNGE